MATIDPTQTYDIIHTLSFNTDTGTCKIRLYRGSSTAFAGTVYYRAGTSGEWTELSVSGTDTTFPISSTTMQVAYDWNKSGNNYMTASFYGETKLTRIAISQKAVLSGAMGNYSMYNYANGCSNLTSLAVPDTSGLTSVGTYFMASYARGCSNLTSLAVPDTSGLNSVGSNFMTLYAYSCTSLAKLLLPKVGWFATHNITWGVPSGREGSLKGYVLDGDDLAGWKALTAETKTLYLNYIRDADDVIYIPSVTARYVDKDHASAADSGAGTESAPWKTIQYAVGSTSATQAGDTIYVKESSTPYNEQVIFDKSGTAGNPITLMAYPGDNPIIDCQGINLGNSISGSLQGAVHIHNKNHIVIDGFEICNSTCMGITVYEQCDNITLKDMYIHETGTCGVYVSCTWNSVTKRPSNILIDGIECYHTNGTHDRETITAVCVDGLEIKNCKIHDTIFDGNLEWPCQNGINPQGCNNMLIHDNEVYNVMDGIYIGGSSLRPESGGVDVYNNYVHGCYWPTHNLGLGLTIGFETVQNGVLTDVDFYNNIVTGNFIGFMDDLMDTNNFYVTFRLINNTFYDNKHDEIIVKKSATYHNSCVIRNNIIYSKRSGAYGIRYDDYSIGGVTIDHNLFYNSGGSWAAQNRLGTDYVTGDPLFVDSTPDSAADYAIQSGSPAKDAGSSTSAPDDDYIGTARPQGESDDIGAYEYDAGGGEEWTHITKYCGIPAANISKINGIAIANIAKINGVAV